MRYTSYKHIISKRIHFFCCLLLIWFTTKKPKDNCMNAKWLYLFTISGLKYKRTRSKINTHRAKSHESEDIQKTTMDDDRQQQQRINIICYSYDAKNGCEFFSTSHSQVTTLTLSLSLSIYFDLYSIWNARTKKNSSVISIHSVSSHSVVCLVLSKYLLYSRHRFTNTYESHKNRKFNTSKIIII